jgi:hypothetical protein
MSLKERGDAKSGPVKSYLAAITIIGIVGLFLMLAGAIALRNGAQFGEDIVGVFMLMTFAILGIVELSLCRQLSRLNRASEKREAVATPLQAGIVNEVRSSQPRALAEPVPSVTENTTRTLEYTRKERPR